MFRFVIRAAHTSTYFLIAGVVAFVAFTLALLVPNAKLLAFGLSFADIPLGSNVSFIISFYHSLFTNFTPLAAVFTVVTSVLFGVNVALLLYYIRGMQGGMRGVTKAGALSLGGLVSGFFGIGCAACGSVIVTALLSVIGASGLLVLLPFGGMEFTFLAIMLLLYSLITLTRHIAMGRVCVSR